MFLTSPFCYLLTINVDWFEPFQLGVYSLGVIYLTVQNLPRNVRYKPENIILVGVMPGPKKASLNINPYLSPLVLELQQAWNEGFTVMSPHQFPITVKLALSCVACDIPASRKVSGFWVIMLLLDVINARRFLVLSLASLQIILGLIEKTGCCTLGLFTDKMLMKY